MDDDRDERSGGFGWGLVVGLAVGVAVGAFLAWGPGREQVAELRSRTIELTDSAKDVLAEQGKVSEAEELYLDEHLDEVFRLVESDLSEEEFRRHPLITLLLARGSRPPEDA